MELLVGLLKNMQVFLPYPSYENSVSVLDNKRLGNQIYRECLTLIRGGWRNHPCSKMWFPKYIHSLAEYALCGLNELKKRGRDYPHHRETFLHIFNNSINTGEPAWFGDDRIHSSHRRALLYKNPEWYSQFGWTEQPDVPNEQGKLNYYWPVK